MKRSYLDHLDGVVSDTTFQDFEFAKMPAGKLFCLQHLSVSNTDDNSRVVHLGIRIGGHTHWFKTLVLTTKTHYYTFENPIYFSTDYQIVVRASAWQATTHLHAVLFGYYVE